MKNEKGNKYGKLTVIDRGENDSHGKARWYCQCECGNTILARGSDLRSGKIKTCGCSSLKAENSIIGQRFGRLEVIECAGRSDSKKLLYKCKCDCGNQIIVIGQNLKNGNTQSCGCYKKESNNSRLFKNETNNVYGLLTVLELDSLNDGISMWRCKCQCGNQIIVRGNDLRSGNTSSCGCLKSAGEEKIIKILLENKINFKTQYSFEDLIFKKPLRYDFAIMDDEKQIVRLIEFDGPQHTDKSSNWYNEESCFRDTLKNQYALSNNYPLVRIPYKERDSLSLELLLSDKYLVRDMV